MLEKLLRVTRLLETYSGLLPRKQAAMCSTYYLDNLSLGEIAENEGISRQAVHDSLERAIDTMEEAESALGLIRKSERMAELCDRIKYLAKSIKVGNDEASLTALIESVDALNAEI